VLEDLWKMGAFAARAANAYAICFKSADGAGLLAAELGAADDAAAAGLLAAMAKRAGCRAVEATLPPGGLFAGVGETAPAALVKPLAAGFAPGQVYLRFGLDQIGANALA
jgi:hypothetical protein